ncbi:MAG TPA: tetratricopeptide repeat protein [Verrucomicrobiae bacterium]|jgi:tetratricopeptide (TPR) repeat protein|nr:tetratricopeptide repeat protein [Verrucomicrobiae bacterium]
MNVMFRPIFLIVCACVFFATQIFAAETNPVVSSQTPDAQNAANGYLLIQEQLHATQLAIENNRQEAEAAAKRNADEMAARIETLEQTIATQRASDAAATQKIEQLTLLLAGVFGLVCVAVMLLMAYLQWRAVARLVALIAPSSALALDDRPLPALATGVAVEQSNARLFGSVDRLEKRILELEQMARPPLPKKKPPVAPELQNGGTASNDDRDECVVNLLIEGQKLVEANAPEKALECFDMALAIQPKHAEALVKKGGALEKLDRLDEAIAFYDRAIEADNSLAIAYLQKGGLFNRLARYDEALQCYEQALRTREKNVVQEKVAA